MIVLDASVLIAYFDNGDTHHARAEKLLMAWAGEELRASPITLAEFYVDPARRERLSVAEANVRALGVQPVPFPTELELTSRLATLRAATSLRLPDCPVLLAAIDVQGSVATFDAPLIGAARNYGLPIASEDSNAQ